MVYVAGERRVHYEAVAELRKLVIRFMRDQIVPHLLATRQPMLAKT
jgi:hypothetical protein